MSPGHRPRTPRGDSHRRPTPEEIRAHQESVAAHAKEALGHIYRAMLGTPEFTLQDGTKCRVDAYYEPEANSDGDLKCGVDVLLGDTGHLEFTVTHTGWGKSLAPGLAGKPGGPGRGR
jgi:hypothetical protein